MCHTHTHAKEFKGKDLHVWAEKRKLKKNQIVMQERSDTVCERQNFIGWGISILDIIEEHSYVAHGRENVQSLCKTLVVTHGVTHIPALDPVIPFLSTYLEKWKLISTERHVHECVSSFFHNYQMSRNRRADRQETNRAIFNRVRYYSAVKRNAFSSVLNKQKWAKETRQKSIACVDHFYRL